MNSHSERFSRYKNIPNTPVIDIDEETEFYESIGDESHDDEKLQEVYLKKNTNEKKDSDEKKNIRTSEAIKTKPIDISKSSKPFGKLFK